MPKCQNSNETFWVIFKHCEVIVSNDYTDFLFDYEVMAKKITFSIVCEALKRCAKKVENSQVGKVLSLVLYYWKRGPFLQTSSDDKSFFQFLEQLFFSSSTFLDDNRCSFIFSYSYCVNRYDIHS